MGRGLAVRVLSPTCPPFSRGQVTDKRSTCANAYGTRRATKMKSVSTATAHAPNIEITVPTMTLMPKISWSGLTHAEKNNRNTRDSCRKGMTIIIGATAKAAYMKPCAAATATPAYTNQRMFSQFTDVTLRRSEGDSKTIVPIAAVDAAYEISPPDIAFKGAENWSAMRAMNGPVPYASAATAANK